MVFVSATVLVRRPVVPHLDTPVTSATRSLAIGLFFRFSHSAAVSRRLWKTSIRTELTL